MIEAGCHMGIWGYPSHIAQTIQETRFSGQTFIRENKRYVTIPMVYCDQTASNRPLHSVGKYIQDMRLPLYGNTYTSPLKFLFFVAEAHQVVAKEVNAKITWKATLDADYGYPSVV